MTIYVVVSTSGGWGGTDKYTNVSIAFTSRTAAEAYVAEYQSTKNAKDDHWNGDVYEVELVDTPATAL